MYDYKFANSRFGSDLLAEIGFSSIPTESDILIVPNYLRENNWDENYPVVGTLNFNGELTFIKKGPHIKKYQDIIRHYLDMCIRLTSSGI